MQKDVWVIERCSIHVHFSATVDPVLKAGRYIYYGNKKKMGLYFRNLASFLTCGLTDQLIKLVTWHGMDQW